ncbi:MAG: hypothetical protein ACI8UG_001585, partial [Gammaproteobacteria bacterium]
TETETETEILAMTVVMNNINATILIIILNP